MRRKAAIETMSPAEAAAAIEPRKGEIAFEMAWIGSGRNGRR